MTWLDTSGTAAHLKASPYEVRRHAFDQTGGKRCPVGCIPGYKVRGRWRFDVAELDAYVRGVAAGPRRITTGRRSA